MPPQRAAMPTASNGSNVIPRRARPGLAGLGPHTLLLTITLALPLLASSFAPPPAPSPAHHPNPARTLRPSTTPFPTPLHPFTPSLCAPRANTLLAMSSADGGGGGVAAAAATGNPKP